MYRVNVNRAVLLVLILLSLSLSIMMPFTGVLIITGCTMTNAYALMFQIGVGFFTAVGAGVLVQTGTMYTIFNGPTFMVSGKRGQGAAHFISSSMAENNCHFTKEGK